MKITALKTTLLLCCYCFILSCNENEEWKSNVHELKVKYQSESAMVNEPFEFTDLSLGITSRLWTFEDATPATSTNPVVKVTFKKPGKKKYTLTLQYDNGSSESTESFIEVKEVLTANIQVPSATPMSCVKPNEAITFISETSSEEVRYEWQFPGGSPATSNKKSPSVTWNKKGFAEVSLKITRLYDNAEITATKKIHVGPYPMLRNMQEFGTDSWSAETGNSIGAWIIWNGSDNIFSQNVAVRCNGGANNTEHAIQVKYNGVTDWQFFPRDMWVSNAKLRKGQKYEFCFYAKSSKPTQITELILINAAYDYMYDAVAQAGIASEWTKFYPNIPLVYTPSETRYVYDSKMEVTNSWKQFRYEFTVGNKDLTGNSVPDVLLNTYPFFVFSKDNGATDIFIDEIEINLLEE